MRTLCPQPPQFVGSAISLRELIKMQTTRRQVRRSLQWRYAPFPGLTCTYKEVAIVGFDVGPPPPYMELMHLVSKRPLWVGQDTLSKSLVTAGLTWCKPKGQDGLSKGQDGPFEGFCTPGVRNNLHLGQSLVPSECVIISKGDGNGRSKGK